MHYQSGGVEQIRTNCFKALESILIVGLLDYAKREKTFPALRDVNLNEESPHMGPQIDNDFVFYLFYSYPLLHFSIFCIILLTFLYGPISFIRF